MNQPTGRLNGWATSKCTCGTLPAAAVIAKFTHRYSSEKIEADCLKSGLRLALGPDQGFPLSRVGLLLDDPLVLDPRFSLS